MQHLTAHNGSFRYRTAQTGKFTEVEVYYYKSQRGKGIVVTVRPVEARDGMMTASSWFAAQSALKVGYYAPDVAFCGTCGKRHAPADTCLTPDHEAASVAS